MEGLGGGRKDVLEICEELETLCAELYHHFADLYKGERASMLLWLKTAMEAENMAKQFALVGKLRRQKIIASIEIDPDDAQITRMYVQSLLERVRAAPPSLEEALRTAIRLEKNLAAFRIENVVKFADQNYGRSFLATQSGGKQLESLQEAYDRLSSR